MVVDAKSATPRAAGNGEAAQSETRTATAELVAGPFKFDKCGLTLNGTSLTLDEWKLAGKKLCPKTGWPWAVGDWLIYGESWRFITSETYDLAEEILDLDHQTLKNYVHVARRVDRTVRRYDLPWAHHQAVAALPSGGGLGGAPAAPEAGRGAAGPRRAADAGQRAVVDQLLDGCAGEWPELSGADDRG